MALPTTITSVTGASGHTPPFKSSGGNFYTIIRNGLFVIEAFKATDPTDSWSAQDTSNKPVGNAAWEVLSVVQDGDLLHIASWGATVAIGDAYFYHTFNMADDTWGVVEEVIDNPPNDPILTWISIAIRSDGDVIVVYNGDTDRVMGGDKERADYARREGGTWTFGVALDAAGDIHYGNPNVVKGPLTDDMHIIWQSTDNTTDPPTAWLQTQARTLRPDNSLSTTVSPTPAVAISGTHLLGEQNFVSYDDAGTQRIVGNSPSTGQELRTLSTTEDGSDDIQLGTGDFPVKVLTDEIHVNGEVGICSIAELSGDLHVLYSGGGANGVDQDLWYLTSTDDGASWTTEAEEIDAITCNQIAANIYTRGGDTVLAYVYENSAGGDKQQYNEKVLIAGAAPGINPVFLLKKKIGMRYY